MSRRGKRRPLLAAYENVAIAADQLRREMEHPLRDGVMVAHDLVYLSKQLQMLEKVKRDART